MAVLLPHWDVLGLLRGVVGSVPVVLVWEPLVEGLVAEPAVGLVVEVAAGLAVDLAVGLSVGLPAERTGVQVAGRDAELSAGLLGELPGELHDGLPAGMVAGLAAGLAVVVCKTAQSVADG